MKIILKIRMLKIRVKLSFIFVMQIDWVLGEVKKAVKSAGIEKETIIMVSSDNGSFMYRLNPDRPDHTDEHNFRTLGCYRELLSGVFS